MYANWAAPSVHMALSVMYSVQLGCTVSPHGTVSHVQCTTGLHRQSTWHCQSCTVYNCAALSVHMTLSVMYSVQLRCTVSPHDIISHIQSTTAHIWLFLGGHFRLVHPRHTSQLMICIIMYAISSLSHPLRYNAVKRKQQIFHSALLVECVYGRF